jgi:hypothetical protein
MSDKKEPKAELLSNEQMLSMGTAFLLENEVLDSPHVKNVLIAGVKRADPSILDAELLADSVLRIALVYVKLSFWGRLLRKQKGLEDHILTEFAKVLPSFRVRVVFDADIFEKALGKAKKLAEGRYYEDQVNIRSRIFTKPEPSASDRVKDNTSDNPTPSTEPTAQSKGSSDTSKSDKA